MHTAQQVLKICTFMSAKSPYVVDKTSNPFDDDDDESKLSTGYVYYELPYTCDDGFWHDTALEILRRANFQELKPQQQQELSKFVRVISDRVFVLLVTKSVDFKQNLIIRYEYDASQHKVAHGDHYHVIMRFEKNKLLIFVCTSNGDRPLNCDPCTKERALGRKDDDDDNDALDVTANSPKVTYNPTPMQREKKRVDRAARDWMSAGAHQENRIDRLGREQQAEARAAAAKLRQREYDARGRHRGRIQLSPLEPLPASVRRSAPGRTSLVI
jgi:hypothetical protein